MFLNHEPYLLLSTMLQPNDTHPKAQEKQISLIRQLSVAERISRLRSFSQTIIQLSRRAVTRVNPSLSREELNCKIIAHHYGNDLAERLHKYLNRSVK
jgi:hypothetical protein